MRESENKLNSLGGSPRGFLATHPQQAQGSRGTCYRSGLHRPPPLQCPVRPTSAPEGHLARSGGLWEAETRSAGSAQPRERRRGKEGTEGLTLRIFLPDRQRGGPHFDTPNLFHQGGECRDGGRQGEWKGRQRCTDQKGEKEGVPSQLGMAEGAGAPRCPLVSALTWITFARLVQTAALQRSESAAPLATGKEGRGRDQAPPPPESPRSHAPRAGHPAHLLSVGSQPQVSD